MNTHTLLARLQTDIPLAPRPFAVIADDMGETEQGVIQAVKSLVDSDVIRSMAPVFEPSRLGYVTTLAAARLDPVSENAVSAEMTGITEITHNYLRDNDYNLWFTVTARSAERKYRVLDHVSSLPGVHDLLDLPIVRRYKIRAVFGDTTDGKISQTPVDQAASRPLTETDIALITRIQRGIPVTERPYGLLAGEAGITEERCLGLLEDWLRTGIVRRFGARIRHTAAGWAANAMCAWKGPGIDTLGGNFACMREVSHCYRRAPRPGWPWELYTMVHARTETELGGIIDGMRALAEGADMLVLRTVRELKKTTMHYFTEEEPWDSPRHE